MNTAANALRLAVVDDHPAMRAGFASMVDKWPHGRVELMASDGVDYERQCAEMGHIHIALVDLRMPRRDGYETLRWITRNQPRTLPMAISFDPQPLQVKQALHAGARAMLSKVVEPLDLLKALDHVRLTGFHYNDLVSKELRREVENELEQQAPDERWASLTPREREFVLLYTNPKVTTLDDAAQRMGIGGETAETYRKNAADKLNARRKAEMVRAVLLNGWR